jgi:hypothetical protein
MIWIRATLLNDTPGSCPDCLSFQGSDDASRQLNYAINGAPNRKLRRQLWEDLLLALWDKINSAQRTIIRSKEFYRNFYLSDGKTAIIAASKSDVS